MSVLEDSWQPGMNEEQAKNVSVMQLHLVFFLMDILDHKLIWLLLQKIKLIISEHMMLSVIRVIELENMDSNLVPHLLFIKRLKSLLKSLKKLLKRWNHKYPEKNPRFV